MSKIVAPYPTRERTEPDPDAQWWRFHLRPNADGNLSMMQIDNADNPTWVSYEFYDGCDTILDAGLDRPTIDEMRITQRDPVFDHIDPYFGSRSWLITRPPTADLDILCAGQPTESRYWCPMTPPGEFEHPDDRPRLDLPRPDYNRPRRLQPERHCTPSRHEARRSRFWW